MKPAVITFEFGSLVSEGGSQFKEHYLDTFINLSQKVKLSTIKENRKLDTKSKDIFETGFKDKSIALLKEGINTFRYNPDLEKNITCECSLGIFHNDFSASLYATSIEYTVIDSVFETESYSDNAKNQEVLLLVEGDQSENLINRKSFGGIIKLFVNTVTIVTYKPISLT